MPNCHCHLLLVWQIITFSISLLNPFLFIAWFPWQQHPEAIPEVVEERKEMLYSPQQITSPFTVTQLIVIFKFSALFCSSVSLGNFCALTRKQTKLNFQEIQFFFAAALLSSIKWKLSESWIHAMPFCRVNWECCAWWKVSLTACSPHVICMNIWRNSKVVIWERREND